MARTVAVAVSAVLVLALPMTAPAAGDNAQAVVDDLAGASGRTWKVANAGGVGFGGYFASKQQVKIVVSGREAVSIDGSEPLRVAGPFAPQHNPKFGTCVSFTLGGFAARIGTGTSGGYRLEVDSEDGKSTAVLTRP